MKGMKKQISLSLALLLSASALFGAGCSRATVVEIDSTKTQLYVQNFDGGFGGEWLDRAATRFEEKYATTPFEDGKQGVQIIIDHTKSMDSNLSSSINNVYFADNLAYFDKASDGSLLDITDMVGTTIPGETKSIKDKLDAEYQSVLPAVNGKYWALPHYIYYGGFVYDIDLFEAENLYFANDRSEFDFVTAYNTQRSVGPDGKLNTYDDGLPSTVEDFYTLFEYMISKNITPMIWAGAASNYVTRIVRALAASLSGSPEAWKINYTLSGTAEIITDYDTLASEKVTITPSNAYLLAQQKSKYQGLLFLQKIFENTDNFHKDSLSSTLSHTDAQETFIYSSLENKPIGMMIEANYWYNEAGAAFERSIEEYGEAAKNRRFGFMPMPTVYSGEVNENTPKQTLVSISSAYSFINGNVAGTAKEELAKLFLQYCHTDETLQDFTKVTNTFKPYDYDIENVVSSLNSYGQNVWEMQKNSAGLVLPLDGNKMFIENSADITESMAGFTAQVGDTFYSIPVHALKKGVTAIDYFKGMKVSESAWTAKYAKYWNNN